MRISGEGPIPTRLMIVGEFPSERDLQVGTPFQDAGGMELNRMLHEAGIMRSECYVTTVVKVRPPQGLVSSFIAQKKKEITPAHQLRMGLYVTPEVIAGLSELYAEIEIVQPNLIIACGNLALWALTENWGVMKWRGSLLRMMPMFKNQGELERPKVIPTYPPGNVLRQWDLRAVVLNDLRRVKRHMTSRAYDNKPEWRFQVRPTYEQVMRALAHMRELAILPETCWLDFDIETVGGHIDCIGLSWSRQDGICIPFISKGHFGGYWNEEQEANIVHQLYQILTHPNVKVRWQNGLYDAQYVHRHWHFIPNGGQDTMISQHSLFAALPKGLAFIASMYADWYVYWKDEGKTSLNGGPEDQRWAYNLQDCVYTREVGEVLADVIKSMGLGPVEERQQAMFWPVLKAMLRGVRIREEVKGAMAQEVQEALFEREAFLFNLLGHGLNPASPKQMQSLFYDDLQLKPILKRTIVMGRVKMSPTCDDEALRTLSIREPLVKPICDAISDIRTLHKFFGDFIMMQPDIDGRMRCSFNIAGDAGGKSAPYSYRLSSSKNAFGSGGNLQTIPSEKSKSSGKAAARGTMKPLPNIRSMYGPDSGFTFFDMDLDRADLQVVVWESDDQMLKAALRMGADIHLLNTYGIDNKEPPPLEELVETHPKYPDHRGPRKHKREFAKVFCHATNYLGKAKTVAAHTGRGIHEIDQAQKRWFLAHPGILAWHQRVTDQVQKYRFVENKFGYRWYIFDRIDEQLLPAAVAWIPQSTVGTVINRAWLAFHEQLPEVQVLLQVHDSLAGQFPTHRREFLLPKMRECSRVVIPYEDPLIIPTGIKTSTVSWGDCE